MFEYKGQKFETELEAKWASFFDLLDWDWSYKPFTLKNYTPNFLLKFPEPIIVDVCPVSSIAELKTHTEQMVIPEWNKEILVVGANLFKREDFVLEEPVLGLLGEVYSTDKKPDGFERAYARAVMMICESCGQCSFYHEEFSWHCRVNGCYDGDRHIGLIGELPNPFKLGDQNSSQDNYSQPQDMIHNQGFGGQSFTLWNNLRFRSKTEVRIAEALERARVLFFPNCKARLGFKKRQNMEPDFLVCHEGKWGILEVDGRPYHPPSRTVEEHERDRIFLAHGVAIVQHFDATECYDSPDEVVKKFLYLLTISHKLP